MEKFFENSTIHGFKYLSKKFHWVERIFWFISLFLSLVLTIVLITKLVEKIKSIPVIVEISDEQVHVSEIDFPAITQCYGLIPRFPYIFQNNQYKYFRYERNTNLHYYYEKEEIDEESRDEKKMGNVGYINNLMKLESGVIKAKNLGLKALKRLQVIDLISRRGSFAKINFSVPTDDFLDVINEFTMQASLESSLIAFSQTYSGPSIVSNIITQTNLCKNYNIALADDVFHTNITSNDFNFQHYNDRRGKFYKNFTIVVPQRSLTSKIFLLVRILTYNLHREHSLGSTKGGLMYFHDPYEMPSKFTQSMMINENQYNEIFVEPQMMEVDESFYDENPLERNCYFDDERKLNFFKVYTKPNCLFECMSEFMAQKCGCVEFFMIRNKTTRICSASEKICYDKVRDEFDTQINDCGCLERCNYVKYNFEYNVRERNTKDLQKVNSAGLNGMMQTNSNIMYKSVFFNKFIRKRQFNEIDFLSFVGGLLGLFAGFSALSFIEIFYWILRKILIKRTAIVHPLYTKQEGSVTMFNNFLDNSSIHGVNYLNKNKLFHKLFWTFFITLSLTLSALMIKNIKKQTWAKSYDDSYNFKDRVLFPAVTFIPNYYADVNLQELIDSQRIKIKNITLLQELYNKNITEQFECIYLIQYKFFNDNKTKPYNLEFMRRHSKVDYFQQQYATWNDKYQVNFTEVRTFYGLAYSFNLLDSSKLLHYNEVHDEFKYKQNISMINQASMPEISIENYPLKVNLKRQSKLTLNVNEEKFENPNMKVCIGMSLRVHLPTDLPQFVYFEGFGEINHSTDVEIIPEITRTDDSLKVLTPKERECYFENERKLKYFKIYTEEYCKMECIIESTIQYCKCVDSLFVYGPKHENLGFCQWQKMGCVGTTRNYYSMYFNKMIDEDCNCLPTCNSLTYHMKFYPRDDENNSIVINVKMNTDQLILYTRFHFFTFSDAVSYVGGLLGLFAGISVLSIVEIFYFITLRLLNDILRLLKRT
ncbi:hypothetical protein PVAND_003306 [Polypedilum vanderplanki]|uniref:Uncharacterized protein n=1 Tax=Polypedilum vanderplanki TaxID=319348 RepID=A0A9J6BUQ6_POLVA|nr:hypothetical protein PVAND_003306 [Polypedilum vanderplanki]